MNWKDEDKIWNMPPYASPTTMLFFFQNLTADIYSTQAAEITNLSPIFTVINLYRGRYAVEINLHLAAQLLRSLGINGDGMAWNL